MERDSDQQARLHGEEVRRKGVQVQGPPRRFWKRREPEEEQHVSATRSEGGGGSVVLQAGIFLEAVDQVVLETNRQLFEACIGRAFKIAVAVDWQPRVHEGSGPGPEGQPGQEWLGAAAKLEDRTGSGGGSATIAEAFDPA